MTSLARPTAGRALHLRITPRPSNLGESREIMRLVSRFGEIEYFKNLKYDALSMPNAALVIFKDEDAAAHCIRKSPIRFRMGKAPVEDERQVEEAERAEAAEAADTAAEADAAKPSAPAPGSAATATATATSPPSPTPSPSPSGGAWGLGQRRAMSTNSSHPTVASLPHPPARPLQMPFQAPPLPLLESRIFQIQSNYARAHFRDQIDMAHYHGRYALDTKIIPQTDLVQTVPLPGLSCVDWRKEDKPWRVMDREKWEERTGSNRRKSLQELYEEG